MSAIYSQAIYPGNLSPGGTGFGKCEWRTEDFYSNNEPYALKTNNFPQTYRFPDLLAGLYTGSVDSLIQMVTERSTQEKFTLSGRAF